MKEAFQRFCDYRSPGWGARYLTQWLWWASHSRLPPFKRFAQMIQNHVEGILAWFELRVSNAALGGMNNKVKIVSHRVYRFRRVDRYTVRGTRVPRAFRITAIRHNCAHLPLD